MPTNKTSHSHASAAPVSTLWMLTCMGAVDGTVLVLAATGRLHSLAAAVVVGLTVVAGAGAWLTARQAFAGPHNGRQYLVLTSMAATSILATVAAAWLGETLGQAVTFHVLPRAVGVVLVLVAAEVGGFHLPRIAQAPLPVVALAAGVLLEVLLAWTP